MFAREVIAPADLVFGIPAEKPPSSYDDYSVEMENRMKQAHSLVREHLGTVEEMKRRYDLRVRPQQFRRGQWVSYYNPRKFKKRQQNGRESCFSTSDYKTNSASLLSDPKE